MSGEPICKDCMDEMYQEPEQDNGTAFEEYLLSKSHDEDVKQEKWEWLKNVGGY